MMNKKKHIFPEDSRKILKGIGLVILFIFVAIIIGWSDISFEIFLLFLLILWLAYNQDKHLKEYHNKDKRK